jgi:hypothetical protein
MKIFLLVPIFGVSGLQLALFLADKTRDSLGSNIAETLDRI